MANGKNDTLKNVGIGALGVGGALAATRPNQFKALVNNVAYKTGVKDLPDGVTLEGLPSMGDSVTKALDVTGNGNLTDELGIAGAVAAGAYLAKKAYNKHMNNQARIALAHAKAVGAGKDMAEGPGFDIKGTVGDITMHNQYEAARRRALKRNDLDAVRRLDDDMEALDDITSARQGSSLLGLAGAGIGGVLGGMMTGTPTGALLGAGLGASTGVVSNLSKVKAEADARQRLRRHTNEDSWDMSAKDFAKETRGFGGQENLHRIAGEDYGTRSDFIDSHFKWNPVTDQYVPNDPNQVYDFKFLPGGTETGESQNMTDAVKEFVGGDGLTPNARALENMGPNTDIQEGLGVGGAVAGALLGGLALKKIYDAYRPRAKRNASYDKDPVEIMENMPVSAKKLSQQKAGVPMAFSQKVGDFALFDWKDTWDILSDAGSNKLARDITDGTVSLATTAAITDKLNLEDPRAIQAASYVGDVAGDVARVGTGAVHGIDTIVEGFKEGDPSVIVPTAIVGTGLGALIARKAMRKGR